MIPASERHEKSVGFAKWALSHPETGFIVGRKALFRKPDCCIIYKNRHSNTACHLLFRIVILRFYVHIPVSGIAPKSPILLRMYILIRLKHIIRAISLRFHHFVLRLRKRLNRTEKRLPRGRFPSFFFRISIYGWSFFWRLFCIIMQNTDIVWCSIHPINDWYFPFIYIPVTARTIVIREVLADNLRCFSHYIRRTRHIVLLLYRCSYIRRQSKAGNSTMSDICLRRSWANSSVCSYFHVTWNGT